VRIDGGTELSAGAFEVMALGPEAFVESARRAVAAMRLPVRVTVALDGNRLVVTVERLGRSVLRYDLDRRGTGFTARLSSRQIAPLHLPFGDDFLDTVTRVLHRVAGETGPSGGEAPHP